MPCTPSTSRRPIPRPPPTIVNNAARELRDEPLHTLCLRLVEQGRRQQAWVDTMIKQSVAQSMVVPS